MAIIAYTLTAPEIMGSIGGTTYTRNAAGTIARRRQKPVTPATATQQFSANLVAHCSQQWYFKLTDAQRVAWNALGAGTVWTNRLGDNYSPTGLNLYIRSATLLLYYGNSPIFAAPATADEGPYTFTVALDGASDIVLTAIGTCIATPHGYLMVWWSRQQRASRYCPPARWTYLKTISFQTLALPETLVAAADAPAGFRYHFRFRVSRTAGIVGFPNVESLLNP